MTLQNGQTFPALTLPKVGGGTLSLPGDLDGKWGVVLIYRGSWCPYCNAQLASFQKRLGDLHDLGAEVVALSVDPEDKADETVEAHGLAFGVGHSADLSTVARATGGFANADAGYLESTGFMLRPDGTILTSVYSSNAIGRLVPADVIGQLQYVQSQG